MQRIEIIHTTTYHYAEPVRFLEHKLHVRPREGHDIRVEASTLSISPAYNIHWQRDVYGNSVAIVSFTEPADKLEIISTIVVQHFEADGRASGLSHLDANQPFQYDAMEQIDLVPYQTALFSAYSARFSAWLDSLWSAGRALDVRSFLEILNQRLVQDFQYIVRDEPGVQSPDAMLSNGMGSCRDLATLFIESCRHFGLASRFVSGYLVSSAAVEDVATTHAWAEVYLPGAGWQGFDATSGQPAGGDHIAVAVHRHPEAIPPVSGSFIGQGKARLQVEVQVNRL